MIITRHEGLQITIDASADEFTSRSRLPLHKLKVLPHNIPKVLCVRIYSTANGESYSIGLDDGIDLHFNDISIATKYFGYFSNYEKYKDLDILTENSSLGI